jgi:ABC-type nitrate/sulfonate/bicarbonate transport system substrate-binding protein
MPRALPCAIQSLLLGALLAACAPSASPGSTAAPVTAPAGAPPAPAAGVPAAAPELVRVLYPSAGGSNTPLYVAKHEGFYRAEGLDVELIHLGAAPSVQAVLAGEADFTGAAAAATPAILAGSGMKFVVVLTDRPPWSLIAAPDIPTVAALKGKRLGVQVRHSLMELAGHDILRQAGLDPLQDVTWLAIAGTPANRLGALAGGAVDGAILSTPENFRAQQEGFRELKFVGEMKLIVGAMAASNRVIQERTPMVERFVRATVKGVRYLKANREAGIQAFQDFGDVDAATARMLYDFTLGTFVDDGETDEATMRHTIERQAQASEVTDLPPIEQVYDVPLTRRALASAP